MWLSLPALFTQFIVPRLLTVASADPNSHKAAGGWRVASLSFLSLELIVIIVRMFAILCIKNTRQNIQNIFFLIKNKSLCTSNIFF